MTSEKICYLIFATDGKGATQLAHTYAETIEQASRVATQWRDERYPQLQLLRVRAEPNGYLFGRNISEQ